MNTQQTTFLVLLFASVIGSVNFGNFFFAKTRKEKLICGGVVLICLILAFSVYGNLLDCL